MKQITFDELLSIGFSKTNKHFWYLFLAYSLSAIAIIFLNIFSFYYEFKSFDLLNVAIILIIYVLSFLFFIYLDFCFTKTYLELMKDKKLKILDFYKFQNYNFLKFLGVYFLSFIIITTPIVLGFLLIAMFILFEKLGLVLQIVFIILTIIIFLILTIFLAVKLSFAKFYVLTDKNSSIIDSIKKSFKTTKGYSWKIFFVDLFFLFLAYACFFIFSFLYIFLTIISLENLFIWPFLNVYSFLVLFFYFFIVLGIFLYFNSANNFAIVHLFNIMKHEKREQKKD
ncbi:MAG: hypothetical protein QXR30_02280 [Candidatus Woesearchaeota archaeon]